MQELSAFVVFDESGALQAMLECKGTSIGGTARDKPCASSSCATRQYTSVASRCWPCLVAWVGSRERRPCTSGPRHGWSGLQTREPAADAHCRSIPVPDRTRGSGALVPLQATFAPLPDPPIKVGDLRLR